MKAYPWYKRYPANALQGKLNLNPAQKGVYDTIIDLCYDRGGPIEEDVKELGRLCGCSTRYYRARMAELIKLEKVQRLPDGRLICRGFRTNSEDFQDEFSANSGPKNDAKFSFSGAENRAKSKAPEAKSGGYRGDSRARARAQTQKPEARSQNPESISHADADRKISKICIALGVTLQADPVRMDWPAQLYELEQSGLDFDSQILPAIQRMVDQGRDLRRVKTLRYFERSARLIKAAKGIDILTGESLAKNKKVSMLAEIPRNVWHSALKNLLNVGVWVAEDMGPPPFEPGCAAPEDIFNAAKAKWVAQGNHPVFSWRRNSIVPHDWEPGIDGFPEPRPFAERKAGRA